MTVQCIITPTNSNTLLWIKNIWCEWTACSLEVGCTLQRYLVENVIVENWDQQSIILNYLITCNRFVQLCVLVKEMWKKRPADWPVDIPFVDPNNKGQDLEGKPKKETLKKMFDYLIRTYLVCSYFCHCIKYLVN